MSIYCGFKLKDQSPGVYLGALVILLVFGIPSCCGVKGFLILHT